MPRYFNATTANGSINISFAVSYSCLGSVRVLFASDGGRLELPHDLNLWEAAQNGRNDVATAVIHLIADILVRRVDE